MISDPITQMRLSMRLESYLSEYTQKNTNKDALDKDEWDTVWRVANGARTENTLTPEIVDDVRIVLKRILL